MSSAHTGNQMDSPLLATTVLIDAVTKKTTEISRVSWVNNSCLVDNTV